MGQAAVPVTKSPGRQRARSGQGPDEMPAGAEARRDTGGGRGRDWDKMPTGAEAEQAGSSERPETGRDAGGG